MKYLYVILLALSFNVFASSIEIYTFENAEQEKIYQSLIEDLRCLVCQNQNIAESNAELAKDMRRKTHEMVKQGKSEKEISAFMVTRYGDFVFYRPPFKPVTWLLWFGPMIAFGLGLVFIVRYMKSQKENDKDEALSEEEIERIKNLHSEQEEK
jgi:cytochrome c-type biogenesis protein CcmH